MTTITVDNDGFISVNRYDNGDVGSDADREALDLCDGLNERLIDIESGIDKRISELEDRVVELEHCMVDRQSALSNQIDKSFTLFKEEYLPNIKAKLIAMDAIMDRALSDMVETLKILVVKLK